MKRSDVLFWLLALTAIGNAVAGMAQDKPYMVTNALVLLVMAQLTAQKPERRDR